MRKEVLVYAACQGEAVVRVMRENEEFNNDFVVSDMLRNYWYVRDKRPVIGTEYNRRLFKSADVFIYQPLSDIYGENSTNNVIKFLKPSCRIIGMPRLSISFLYPFFISYKRDMAATWDYSAENYIITNIEPVKTLRQEGLSDSEILEMFDNNKIDWNFDIRKKTELLFLRNQEKESHVKVVDFIDSNFRDKRLFVFYSHASANLYVHMANQIMEMLGLSSIKNKFSDNEFNRCGDHEIILTHPQTMPTSAVNHWGLTFETENGMIMADEFYRKRLGEYLSGIYGS